MKLQYVYHSFYYNVLTYAADRAESFWVYGRISDTAGEIAQL